MNFHNNDLEMKEAIIADQPCFSICFYLTRLCQSSVSLNCSTKETRLADSNETIVRLLNKLGEIIVLVATVDLLLPKLIRRAVITGTSMLAVSLPATLVYELTLALLVFTMTQNF